MTVNLGPGVFKIVSLTKGNPPTGINDTLPTFQTVRVNEPVQKWTLKQVGDHIYRLSIGGYPYTGVVDDKVTASINPEDDVEWKATYREAQDAYTISPTKDLSRGWTIPPDFSTNPEIEINPITSTRSIPPHFLPNQLFRFGQVDE